MIVLKISNASEFVAKKVGKFLESLTPESFDQATVEDTLMRKLIENLSAEGFKGEVASIQGLDLQEGELVIQSKMNVRSHRPF
jgi:hypothetical protein